MKNVFGIHALEPINKNAFIITDGQTGCTWTKSEISTSASPDYLFSQANDDEGKIFTLLVDGVEHPVKFVFRKVDPATHDYNEWAVECLTIITDTGVVQYNFSDVDGTSIKLFEYYMVGQWLE